MTRTQLTTGEKVLREDLDDPEFRADWERTALARALGVTVLRYRTDRDLSQRALGKLLGMPQSQVARLESGEHNPSIEMLVRLCRALGLEFAIDIRPAERPARYVTKQARAADAIANDEAGETVVLFAAG